MLYEVITIRFRNGFSITLELGPHAGGQQPIQALIAESALHRIDELDREIAMRVRKLRLCAGREAPDAPWPSDPAALVGERHQALFREPVEMLADGHGRDANPAGELPSRLRPLLLEVQQYPIPGALLRITRHSAKIPVQHPFATRSSRTIR